MRFRHATAFALVGWYLITPPIPVIPLSPGQALHQDTAAALSRWTVVETFPTEKECDAHRGCKWERCVAADDPRLKGN
jgi:hypothetical protein